MGATNIAKDADQWLQANRVLSAASPTLRSEVSRGCVPDPDKLKSTFIAAAQARPLRELMALKTLTPVDALNIPGTGPSAWVVDFGKCRDARPAHRMRQDG